MKGNTVILVETDQPQLKNYIGTEWKVDAVMDAYHPASAMISKDNLKATTYLRHLEVMPPPDSPFKYNDMVKVCKSYSSHECNVPYTCNKRIIGGVGHIRGYDSRNSYYFIICVTGGQGWFPIQSLLPLDFKGERFYYPFEKIKYKDNEKLITNVKPSKFNWGQLLLVDGEWIPSSDVSAIP